MNILFGRFIWQTCLIYSDDVIVILNSLDVYLNDVDKGLSSLREAVVSLNLEKCWFIADSAKYRGQIIKPGALINKKTRLRGFMQSQRLRVVSERQSFIELCPLYQGLVCKYADIAAPLTKFFRKGQPKKLLNLHKHKSQGFDKWIWTISSKPVLAFPLPDLPFAFYADVSDYRLRAALFQDHPDWECKPVGFWSQSLN